MHQGLHAMARLQAVQLKETTTLETQTLSHKQFEQT